MSICSCCLPVLLFITAVYSASMRGHNEEFLSFLNDAFNMITPPESPAPEIISVSDTPNFVHLPDPDPTAVCTTPAPVYSSADILEASINLEQESLTFSDTADEKSKENSNSADRTDSDDRSSKKRNRLPENLGWSPDYNSADSNSADMTNTDTDERPSKTQGPVTVHQNSEEMGGRLNFEKHRGKKRMMDRVKLSENGIAGTKVPEATYNYPPQQSLTNERKRNSKSELKVDIPLSDTEGSTDPQLDCVEVSSKAMGNLNGENTRTAGPGTDPQNKDGITNYKSQLKRMCAARKRLRTLSIPREPLDPDSAERVNSELLDRDNSNERMDAGMPALFL
ncbi:uncharacterized protein zgc:194210 [Astyanax mexicanus]|uniref:uncharacterized protein zgc:194210 n=1 Tax=Astyanax mexicanus TaxID=7994 RepID=UPI0020CAAB2B|nr:uncharacterized protein zgc:194210 [Astyanax mexicanus]